MEPKNKFVGVKFQRIFPFIFYLFFLTRGVVSIIVQDFVCCFVAVYRNIIQQIKGMCLEKIIHMCGN